MGGKQRPHTHRTAASSSSSRRTGATTTTTTFGFGGLWKLRDCKRDDDDKGERPQLLEGILEEQLSFGAGGDGDEERLMKAIALTAKPNAQSKKKGLEQVIELLEEKERNNNNNWWRRDGTANIQNEFESIASMPCRYGRDYQMSEK